MSTLVRLRIALADDPGSLARVAGIIAGHGGNITSVDVHKSGIVGVVDDIVVDFNGNTVIRGLRDELASSGAGSLLSHSASHQLDGIVSAYSRAAKMVSLAPVDPEAELVSVVKELCQSPVAWVSGTEEAKEWEAGRFALERGGPIALRTVDLPARLRDLLPGENWLLAVPDGEPVAGSVVFVARALTAEFTGTEIARIEALISFHEAVEREIRRR